LDLESITEHVRAVLMLGQTVTAGLRRHVAMTWHADAANFTYGSSETGTIATGCRSGVLHAIDERFVLEVRTGTDLEPFATATRGELVVTPLHADVTILLRYATGDTVRRVACACGTPGAAFVVEGREDDVVQGPHGPLGAEEVENLVYEVPDALDYLLDIDQHGQVRQLRLLLRRGAPVPDTTVLASAMGAPVTIVDEIPSAARAGALVKSWKQTRTVQKFWPNR
jgi:phenylacetate-CoA ligase